MRKPAHPILNRFDFAIEHFFLESEERRKGFRNNQREDRQFSGNAGRSEVARRHDTTSPLAHPPQEQPVKSNSAAVVVAPAVTFSGMAVASLLVV